MRSPLPQAAKSSMFPKMGMTKTAARQSRCCERFPRQRNELSPAIRSQSMQVSTGSASARPEAGSPMEDELFIKRRPANGWRFREQKLQAIGSRFKGLSGKQFYQTASLARSTLTAI